MIITIFIRGTTAQSVANTTTKSKAFVVIIANYEVGVQQLAHVLKHKQ